MATPPSYQEATARQDWLRLAAPYIDFADYHALCLVDRRSWSIFAPLLWADIVKSASRSAPAKAHCFVNWWPDFVTQSLPHVRPLTRSLVRILDLRHFAEEPLLAFDHASGLMQQSLKRALELLPELRSFLLDGHTRIDPSFLSIIDRQARHRGLVQLSVSDCSVRLSHAFFRSPCLRNLVFLDISGLSGSLGCILTHNDLPNIRVLKIRNRELDDRTCALLVNTLQRRLWSLDLSGNKLTDSIIEPIVNLCLPLSDLRHDARFQAEGRLASAGHGSQQYGAFCFIQESRWSESFSHPERYLTDTPRYRRAVMAGTQPPWQDAVQRSDCRFPPRSDHADPVSQLLSGALEPLTAVDQQSSSRGLTHLSLSDNEVSAFGIDRLFRESRGHLAYFACDAMPLFPIISTCPRVWPRSARLHGIVGREHLFRPVIASNLQSLRIHHSIVTNIPTLQMGGLSTLARALLAETLILPRVDLAFPLTLVPDTNPRLTSLTLTRIPPMSTGPLIERLINLLSLLCAQECAVQDTREMLAACHSSNVLRGIRHLRLEFDAESPAINTADEDHLDAAALLESGDRGFSFFESEPGKGSRESGAWDSILSSSPTQAGPQPADDDDREFITHNAHWRGSPYSVDVWIGSPTLASSNTLVREYRRLVLACQVREAVGPVTPGQIRAGAPQNCYIFHGTWCMAIMPRELPAPSVDEIAGMRDVVKALWEYRKKGLAAYERMERDLGKGRVPPGKPHWFWRGKIEVVCDAKSSTPSH